MIIIPLWRGYFYSASDDEVKWGRRVIVLSMRTGVRFSAKFYPVRRTIIRVPE